MKFEETLEASRAQESDLGATAHVMLAALEAGGADPGTLARIRADFDAWLPRVTPEDARTLIAVLEARLVENHERGAFDDDVQLAARLTSLEAHIVHDALAEQGIATRLLHDGPPAADFPDPPSQVELWVRPPRPRPRPPRAQGHGGRRRKDGDLSALRRAGAGQLCDLLALQRHDLIVAR